MKTRGIEFKQFKSEIACKMNKVELGKVSHVNPRSPKNSEVDRTPHKPPTSFRELSGSRDKNKLFSGKKAVLENKLNTLRENEKVTKFNNRDPHSKDEEVCEFSSEKKEGLFKRLLSSRSPHSINKVLNFDETKDGSSFGSNDYNSTMTFSAFKDININEENLNSSNLALQKVVSTGETACDAKGLKFKKFPHKKQNGTIHPTEKVRSPQKYLNFGPIISEKSKSKNKNQSNKLQETFKVQSKVEKIPIEPSMQKFQKIKTISEESENFVPMNLMKSNSTIGHEPDEVIRSIQGSLTFNMSPSLF